MSLHRAALEYHLEHADKHVQLETLLQEVRRREELAKPETNSLVALTKALYRDFLLSFNGIVCSTPMAASNFQFRTHFRPDMVLIDEGGRLQDAEFLVLIAWFEGHWILVGDKYQLAPFVAIDSTADNDAQSHNPFVRQVAYSALARAVDAGATKSYLRFNYRAYGNLAAAPSTLIYWRFMDVPTGKDMYPESVRSINRILRQTRPDMSRRECTLVVSV